MYTQCPDCSTAFRVTAEVLKQAAGKVRCGGCGIAFNALEYLSEDMPEKPTTQDADVSLPELTPEPHGPDAGPPQAISAEQSAALLKTLDELAGSDIRIEDTGVEWRVLDDSAGAEDLNDAGSVMADGVDELLDESPTPVDQFLTDTPNDIDAREIFEEPKHTPAQTPVDELRFDDNTPLPDDFDAGDPAAHATAIQGADASAVTAEPPPQASHARDVDDAPVDIALGDADEWADILGEFSGVPKPYVPPLDAELAALAETEAAEPGNAARTERADTVPPDMDTQFALQAEAMGIDLSGLHATSSDGAVMDDDPTGVNLSIADGAEAASADGATAGNGQDVNDPEHSGEAFGGAPFGADTVEDAGAESANDAGDDSADHDVDQISVEPGIDENERAANDAVADSGDAVALELAEDTGTALQLDEAHEDHDDASLPSDADQEGATLVGHSEAEDLTAVSDAADEDDAPLEFGSIESAMAELEEQSDVFDSDYFDDSDIGAGPEAAADEAGETAIDSAEADVDAADVDAAEVELLDDSADMALDGDDSVLDIELEADRGADAEDAGSSPDDELDAEDLAFDFESDAATAGDEESADDLEATEVDEHVVPAPTEEEQTLNRFIDQELLSMAVEDEDGFASTIVVADQDARDALTDSVALATAQDTGTGFESIIMEGEFVQTALEKEKREADIAEAAALAELARQEREAEAEKTGGGRRYGMAAAAGLLALLLIVQVLHQSREALATIPVFNDTVGPLYRAIGMPLAPAWDVTGWRFEARRDLLDEETDSLTVISRVGNTSDKPLPYPLINITLTDRFEETIGTRTLEPGDYLTDNLDPGQQVQPGSNFTAVMTIQSPSAEATGYKLQACYRQPDLQLRCHLPNFK